MTFLCGIFVLSGCTGLNTGTRKTVVDRNISAIYTAILTDEALAASGPSVILRELTSTSLSNEYPLPARTLVYIRQNLSGTDPELLSDFQHVNASPRRIADAPTLPVPTILLTRPDSEAIFGKDGWNEFYRRHPDSGGIFTVSSVGFSRSATRALAYAARTTGRLTGVGYYFLLEKRGSVWTITGKILAWKS